MRLLVLGWFALAALITLRSDRGDNPRALLYAGVSLYQQNDYQASCSALHRSVSALSPMLLKWDANVYVAAQLDLQILKQSYRACP